MSVLACSDTTSSGAIAVECDRLGRWAAAWDELTEHAVVPTPFLRSWWLDGVRTPGSLFVLVVDRDQLIGGLALERRQLLGGVFVFAHIGAGKLCPDYLDLVAVPTRIDDVVSALQGWWRHQGNALLEVDGAVGGTRLSMVFPDARVRNSEFTSFEPLVGTYETYLMRRSQNTRGRLRRVARRFDAAGVTCRRVEGLEVLGVLESFWALHAARTDREALMYERERLDRAVAQGAAVGEVAAYVAERGGETLVIQLEFEVAGRVCVYQQARVLDRAYDHLGTRLSAYSVEDSYRRGRQVLDLLRGDEPYKASVMGKRHDLGCLRVARGWRGRARLVLRESIDRARAVLRQARKVTVGVHARTRGAKVPSAWIRRMVRAH